MRPNPYLKHKQQHNDSRANLPSRLKLLMGIALVLMVALVLQLALLTIKEGAGYRAEVNRSDEVITKGNVPRGLIYDTKGQVITSNQAHPAVTFTRDANVSATSMAQTATKLSQWLTVDQDKLTKQAMADYYLAADASRAQKLQSAALAGLSKKERSDLSQAAIQQKTMVYLADHAPQLTAAEKNAAMIFYRMNGAYESSTTFIKENQVSDDELAHIGERLTDFPGIKIGRSWSREYPSGQEFKTLVGTVTTEATGLPDNRLHRLLAQGYSQNEPVGNSSLEKVYESTLKGSASQTVVHPSAVSGSDTANTTLKYPGQAGNNLQLTIDAKYQQAVQEILERNLPGGDVEGAYATVINPYTGGVYAMAGVDRDYQSQKISANPLGNINHPIIMGSAVKPAMLAMGFQHKLITATNNTVSDQAIQIAGTPAIKSYWNQSGAPSPITAQTALEVSSNTYMVKLALQMGGQPYQDGMGLSLAPNTFQLLRNGFGQFGLGTKTGIDLDGETAGFRGPTTGDSSGKALFESFGNYDSYTVIQMARYVSAIANGGYVVQPHLVDTIGQTTPDGKTNKTIWKKSRNVQNQVQLTDGEWDVIHQGMHMVANGSNAWNTGGEALHKLTPKVNAKTGTAETMTNGHATFTESIVLYVPGQPMALAMAIPGMNNYLDGTNTRIAAEIVDAYWKYASDKPH